MRYVGELLLTLTSFLLRLVTLSQKKLSHLTELFSFAIQEAGFENP